MYLGKRTIIRTRETTVFFYLYTVYIKSVIPSKISNFELPPISRGYFGKHFVDCHVV